MARTISVGELRQNPTSALDEVLGGATVVVLRHNRAIADLVPHLPPPGIGGTDLMARLRPLPVDDAWLDDLAAARAADDRDLWA
ncbi:type II toxin-antitoxin system Phd/YefM family antitoxin [Microbacterium sp.]|uniref:type II toxin-antitoxin system Phd/YefM family antitoxin n=1 Tax=Microbacterium sp. TaxID=51671 RepID=UPI0039E57827